MKENTQEKSLVQVNNKGIFFKIKQFFINFFHKKDVSENILAVEPKVEITKVEESNRFIEELKNIETEETKLLKLQKRYRNGEIKEKDLSKEQINLLSKLYDKQIANLKKSNEARKQKLLQYRMKMQNN